MELVFRIFLSRHSPLWSNSCAADALSHLLYVMACVSTMKEAPLLSI
jgi:hypothetical protein